MEVIVIAILAWSIIMFLLLCFCPKDRIPLIIKFFVQVWPKLPISAMSQIFKKNDPAGK
tara:strand:- start:123 stop:299 length:177 start_codon:yes stop_codon:yes gene_type:complete